jgi:hypothetical protein
VVALLRFVRLTAGTRAPDVPSGIPGCAFDKSIELTRPAGQIDQVIGATAGAGSIAALLSGLNDVQQTLEGASGLLNNLALSWSFITGLVMLAAFPEDGGYLGNAEVARLLSLNPSTAHRYCSTLVDVWLLERDPDTRRCRRPRRRAYGSASSV